MIAGKLAGLLRLNIFLQASMSIIEDMLWQFGIEFVVRHGSQGRYILKIALLHPQLNCVILIEHLPQTL